MYIHTYIYKYSGLHTNIWQWSARKMKRKKTKENKKKFKMSKAEEFKPPEKASKCIEETRAAVRGDILKVENSATSPAKIQCSDSYKATHTHTCMHIFWYIYEKWRKVDQGSLIGIWGRGWWRAAHNAMLDWANDVASLSMSLPQFV